jgi:hypothetical protein
MFADKVGGKTWPRCKMTGVDSLYPCGWHRAETGGMQELDEVGLGGRRVEIVAVLLGWGGHWAWMRLVLFLEIDAPESRCWIALALEDGAVAMANCDVCGGEDGVTAIVAQHANREECIRC